MKAKLPSLYTLNDIGGTELPICSHACWLFNTILPIDRVSLMDPLVTHPFPLLTTTTLCSICPPPTPVPEMLILYVLVIPVV